MPIETICTTENIYEYPSKIEKSKGLLALGDLHGNAVKLLYFLIRHAVIELDKNNFESFVNIYSKLVYELTKKDIHKIVEIINKIQVINKDTIIHLIGDEFADRGSNDYFTLQLLEKIYSENAQIEIVLSNHSFDFICAYERFEDYRCFKAKTIVKTLCPSLLNLQKLIDEELVHAKEILRCIDKAYKPSLKLISCSLNKDRSSVTIYSHAAIDLKVIEACAIKLGVDYKDKSAKELAETICNINFKFAEYVWQGTINTLCDKETIILFCKNRNLKKINFPIKFIMWNRKYKILDRTHKDKSYRINYVHGHDSDDPKFDKEYPSASNVSNLDSKCGKISKKARDEKIDNQQYDDYRVVHSDEYHFKHSYHTQFEREKNRLKVSLENNIQLVDSVIIDYMSQKKTNSSFDFFKQRTDSPITRCYYFLLDRSASKQFKYAVIIALLSSDHEKELKQFVLDKLSSDSNVNETVFQLKDILHNSSRLENNSKMTLPTKNNTNDFTNDEEFDSNTIKPILTLIKNYRSFKIEEQDDDTWKYFDWYEQDITNLINSVEKRPTSLQNAVVYPSFCKLI